MITVWQLGVVVTPWSRSL